MDELTALLSSRSWIRRRVDRLEFLDLSTVHRSIVFTLDLDALKLLLPYDSRKFPVGLLRRDAMRAGTRVVDADGNALAYLPRVNSDERVMNVLERRFARLDIPVDQELQTLLGHVQNHRARSCDLLSVNDEFDGYADLAAEKWGCPAVGRLLLGLQGAYGRGRDPDEIAELARLLFDWQNNYVLFVPSGVGELPESLETLEFSYDEELAQWQPPWERRRQAVGRNKPSKAADKQESVRIGRAPFAEDLDALFPSSSLGRLAAKNRASVKVRALGRRGLLSLGWHVAWEQASSRDVSLHLVEVTLPPELAVVRMRMAEARLVPSGNAFSREERVMAAPLSMSRVSLLAPTIEPAQAPGTPQLVGVLMSLVVAQRRRGPWLAGSLVAAVTGIAMILAALLDMEQIVSQAGAAVTILLLAPTLVAAVLSIRAASDIAQELTRPLRALIALIGIVTVAAAISLILPRTPSRGLVLPRTPLPGLVFPRTPLPGLVFPRTPLPGLAPTLAPDLGPVKDLWLLAGIVLVIVAVVLVYGWVKLGGQLTYRDPLASGREESVATGHALFTGTGQTDVAAASPRIPPPDRWIETGEGDRLPWGWMWFEPVGSQTRAGWGWGEDNRFWNSVYENEANSNERGEAAELVKWRQSLFVR